MLESLRHAEKDQEGHITEEGRAAAFRRGEEIGAETLAAEPGTVTFVVPSNVGRAVETRDALEGGIAARLAGEADIVAVAAGDAEALGRARDDGSGRRVVVTGLWPQRLAGFGAETVYLPAWKRFTARFGGDEYHTMLAWAARAGELPSLAQEIAVAFPGDAGEPVAPSEFRRTPEREALNYLRLYRRFGEIAAARFPGRPTRFVQVGHNTADFATIALLGQEISLASVRGVLGGESRRYIEPARYDAAAATVSFRGATQPARPIDEAVAALEAASLARAREWAAADGVAPEEVARAYEI